MSDAELLHNAKLSVAKFYVLCKSDMLLSVNYCQSLWGSGKIIWLEGYKLVNCAGTCVNMYCGTFDLFIASYMF